MVPFGIAMNSPTDIQEHEHAGHAHRLIEEFRITLVPDADAVDTLASRLEHIRHSSLTAEVARTSLRRALSMQVSETVWDLVRPADWRFHTSGQITSHAICARVPKGVTWWADHTRLECYTAGDTPESGAYRPASYWGRLNAPVHQSVLERKLAVWWEAEHPTISWNKRWVTAISRLLSHINRDLGISLAVAALRIPNPVFDIHEQISALWVPRLRGSAQHTEIAPSEVEHLKFCTFARVSI